MLAPALLTVFGLLALLLSYQLSLGTLTRPAPGLWPFTVSVLVAVTGAALFVGDRPQDYECWDRRSSRVIAGVGTLAAFVILFQVLGFMPAAALLLLVWMWALGHESWRTAVPAAVAGAVVLHLLFVEAFAVPFPPGLITWGVS